MAFLRPLASPLPAGTSGTNVELRVSGWCCVEPKVDVVTLTRPWFLGPQTAMMIFCGGVKVAMHARTSISLLQGLPEASRGPGTQGGSGHGHEAIVIVHPLARSFYSNRSVPLS